MKYLLSPSYCTGSQLSLACQICSRRPHADSPGENHDRRRNRTGGRGSGAAGFGKGRRACLLDADDDCPAEYGPLLLARAQAARPDRQVSVVLANREFEAWFLAAAPSLAGQFGFPGEFSRPQHPETPRDCKGLLTKARPKGQPYKETVDQAPLTSVFDLKMAREHSDSFDKFYREVSRLLEIGQGVSKE